MLSSLQAAGLERNPAEKGWPGEKINHLLFRQWISSYRLSFFVKIAEKCHVFSLAMTTLMWFAIYLWEWYTETWDFKGASRPPKFTAKFPKV